MRFPSHQAWEHVLVHPWNKIKTLQKSIIRTPLKWQLFICKDFHTRQMASKSVYIYIYIYSFSRRFYPKRLTIEEYNKRYIIKRQTVTESACNTTFQALFRAKLARLGEQMCFCMKKKKQKSSEDGIDEVSGVAWKLSGTSQERWMEMFWNVILCLSVMAPRGVAHSQISGFWRGCRLSSVGRGRRVMGPSDVVYVEKRSGPRTYPWGTPVTSWCALDSSPPQATLKDRPVR